MLYISRCIGKTKYGVVDTEDEVEEVVTQEELADIVRLGIVIEGAVISCKSGKLPELVEAFPYCVHEHNSTTLMKLRILYGIDIHVRGNIITMLGRDDRVVKEGFRIRLSDYGRVLGNHFLFDPSFGMHHKTVILELDDKLALMEDAFNFASKAYVKLDITNVDEQTVVDAVYHEHWRNSSHLPIEDLIIDKPERMEYYRVLEFLKGRPDAVVPTCPQSVKDKFTEKFRPEIMRMSEYTKNITCIAGQVERDFVSSCVAFMDIVARYLDGDVKEFDEIRIINPETVFTFLGSWTTCSVHSAALIARYILYLDPPEDIKRAYEGLFCRLCDWVEKQYEGLE